MARYNYGKYAVNTQIYYDAKEKSATATSGRTIFASNQHPVLNASTGQFTLDGSTYSQWVHPYSPEASQGQYYSSAFIGTFLFVINGDGTSYDRIYIRGHEPGYYLDYTYTTFVSEKITKPLRGVYLGNVIAEDGTYPTDGVHSDGFWYVKESLASGGGAPTAPVFDEVENAKVGALATVYFRASRGGAGSLTYEMQYRARPTDSWINLPVTGANSSWVNASFTVPNIPSIFFRARAYDGSMYSDWGESWGTTVTPRENTPPGIPSTITASGDFKPGGVVTVTAAKVVDPDGDEVRYHFQVSTNGNTWNDLTTANGQLGNTYTYTIPANMTYATIRFSVRALDQDSNSSWRDSVPYPLTFNTAPTAPTFDEVLNLKAGEEATVYFNKSTDADGDTLTYELQYKTSAASAWTTIPNTVSSSWLSGKFTVPSAATVAFFRARAHDGKEYSAWTETGSNTVSRNTAPTTPATITATGNFRPGGEVTVTSGISTDADKDSVTYILQYSLDNVSWVNINQSDSGRIKTFTIPSDATSDNIYFRVRAYDGQLYSGYRNSIAYTLAQNTAPNAPNFKQILNVATGETAKVHFYLAYDMEDDALTYEMQYKFLGSSSWVDVPVTVLAEEFTGQFVIPVGVMGVSVRARANDGKLNSDWKEHGVFNVKVNSAPTTPASLSVTGEFYSGGELTIEIGASTDADGDAISYRVEYSLDGDNYSEIGLSSNRTVKFTVPNTDSTIIFVSVRAFDGKEHSQPTTASYLLNSNTAPSTPETLSVTGVFKTGGLVNVTSSPATDAEGDTLTYQIDYSFDNVAWTNISNGASLTASLTIPANASNLIYFRVRAYDGEEYSGYKVTTGFALNANTAPTAPTAVYIEGNPLYMNKRDIYTLHIEGATDAEGDALRHYISISMNEGASWQLIAAVTTDTFRYVVAPEVTPNLMFRVRSHDGKLYSPFTESDVYIINSKAEVTLTSPDENVRIQDGENFEIAGTVLDTDPYQEVTVHYQVEGFAEQFITSTISGAVFNFSKVLTFKENALYDGTTLVASNILGEGESSGSKKITVFAKDNLDTYSALVVKTLTFEIAQNQKPTITISKDSVTLVGGNKEKVVVTAFEPNLESVIYKVNIQGHATTLIDSLGTSDGVNPLVGDFTLSSVGNVILFAGTDGIEKQLSDGTVSPGVYVVEVQAEDDFGNESDIKTVTVTIEAANNPPVLDVSIPPSIVMVNSGDTFFFGSVEDLDAGDNLTLEVLVNGKVTEQIELEEDGFFFYSYSSDGATVGFKTFVFTASDGKETTSVTRQLEIIE